MNVDEVMEADGPHLPTETEMQPAVNGEPEANIHEVEESKEKAVIDSDDSSSYDIQCKRLKMEGIQIEEIRVGLEPQNRMQETIQDESQPNDITEAETPMQGHFGQSWSREVPEHEIKEAEIQIQERVSHFLSQQAPEHEIREAEIQMQKSVGQASSQEASEQEIREAEIQKQESVGQASSQEASEHDIREADTQKQESVGQASSQEASEHDIREADIQKQESVGQASSQEASEQEIREDEIQMQESVGQASSQETSEHEILSRRDDRIQGITEATVNEFHNDVIDQCIIEEEPVHELHKAVFRGSIDEVTVLVAKGVSVNCYDEQGLTPLHYAVITDNINMIFYLLHHGANKDSSTNDKNQTPVHWAAKLGRQRCLKVLANFGASLTPIDSTEEGKAPIHMAVKYNNIEIVKLLLQLGVNVDSFNGQGQTSLVIAIEDDFIEIARLLIDKGADINVQNYEFEATTPLHHAVGEENLDMIFLLLSKGADTNLTCCAEETPIHWAVTTGNIDILKMMLKFNVNFSVQKRNAEGDCPIHLAVRKGHLHVVQWLICKGIHVDIITTHGYTPIHIAAKLGHNDISTYLLEKGANVNLRTVDSKKYSPLDLASYNNKIEMVNLLVHYGADINAYDKKFEYTALHYAVRKNHLDCVKRLVMLGGNIAITRGEQLITTAVKHGSEDVAKWLMQQGLPVNAHGKFGKTALHCAADVGRCNMTLLLLKGGASVNSLDNELRTPLHYAVKKSHLEVVGMLLTWKADLKAVTKDGLQSVHLAACSVEPFCLQLLMVSGADIMTPTNHEYGDLPIHIAASNGREKIVRWLLTKGVPVDVSNKFGCTAMLSSVASGHFNIVKLFLENGARVNSRYPYRDNSSALHVACFNRDINLIKLLIHYGIDINACTSSDNRTPLHSSIMLGFDEVTKVLVEKGANIELEDKFGYTPKFLATYKSSVAAADFIELLPNILDSINNN